MWNHTVGILIGGQSRRMGTPKHQVELPRGTTMLDAMLDFASSTACRTVIVGAEGDDIKGYQCIQDHRNLHGPVAGIEALLESGIDTRYLVVGCDMPLLKSLDVAPLLCDDDAAVFCKNGTILGLPLMISGTASVACTKYLDAGERSIRGFVATITHTSFPVDESLATALTSINTPDDLHNLSLK